MHAIRTATAIRRRLSESNAAGVDADVGTLKADGYCAMAAIQHMADEEEAITTPTPIPAAPARSASQPVMPVPGAPQLAYVPPPAKVISWDFAATAVQERKQGMRIVPKISAVCGSFPSKTLAPPSTIAITAPTIKGLRHASMVLATHFTPVHISLRLQMVARAEYSSFLPSLVTSITRSITL